MTGFSPDLSPLPWSSIASVTSSHRFLPVGVLSARHPTCARHPGRPQTWNEWRSSISSGRSLATLSPSEVHPLLWLQMPPLFRWLTKMCIPYIYSCPWFCLTCPLGQTSNLHFQLLLDISLWPLYHLFKLNLSKVKLVNSFCSLFS